MKDSFNRNINYLRVSITDRCNLRCKYCMSEDGIEKKLEHSDILTYDEITSFVRLCAKNGINSVRITGGEPLVRRGVEDLVKQLADIDGIKDVSLTTNGILLPQYAEKLKEAGLNRINISLDTLNPDYYKKLTRVGNLEDALAGIDAALACGLDPIKINCVANKNHEIDYYEVAKLSDNKKLHIRFIEYMPIGMNYDSSNFITWENILNLINKEASKRNEALLKPINDAPRGNGPAKYYKFSGSLGSVGFISAISNQFCSECNRIRLTADGKIRPCLFSDEEYSVRQYLRDDNLVQAEQELIKAVNNKPNEHGHNLSTLRQMNQIGG